MAAQYKRSHKNFFIKKDLQGKVILAIFLAVIISGLFFIVMFGLFSADSMTISYENNELQMGQTPAMLLKNAIAANWIFIVICGTLVVLGAMVGTHRIAGPLFRFEKSFDSMTKRNLSDTIYLRGKDEGKDLAAKINLFNQNLSNDIRDLSRHSRAVDDLMKQYCSLDTTSLTPGDIDSICEAIQKNNTNIGKILELYSLADE